MFLSFSTVSYAVSYAVSLTFSYILNVFCDVPVPGWCAHPPLKVGNKFAQFSSWFYHNCAVLFTFVMLTFHDIFLNVRQLTTALVLYTALRIATGWSMSRARKVYYFLSTSDEKEFDVFVENVVILQLWEVHLLYECLFLWHVLSNKNNHEWFSIYFIRISAGILIGFPVHIPANLSPKSQMKKESSLKRKINEIFFFFQILH